MGAAHRPLCCKAYTAANRTQAASGNRQRHFTGLPPPAGRLSRVSQAVNALPAHLGSPFGAGCRRPAPVPVGNDPLLSYSFAHHRSATSGGDLPVPELRSVPG